MALAEEAEFPDALTPFHLIPTTELTGLVTLDLRNDSYRIDLAQKTLPPQVDCLRSLYEPDASTREDGTGAKSPAARQAMAPLKDLVGKISKPHAITQDTALQRRRHRIPEAATHFVWAYQLRPWSTDALTGEQLTTLEMYSGEISLASYGGFIYFDEETEEVVGINAISLGDSPAFREGVVDRAEVLADEEVARGAGRAVHAPLHQSHSSANLDFLWRTTWVATLLSLPPQRISLAEKLCKYGRGAIRPLHLPSVQRCCLQESHTHNISTKVVEGIATDCVLDPFQYGLTIRRPCR
jgi:hypothetical protein